MRPSRSGNWSHTRPLCLTRSNWSMGRPPLSCSCGLAATGNFFESSSSFRALSPLFPLLPAIPRLFWHLRFSPGRIQSLPPSRAPSLLLRSSSVVVSAVSTRTRRGLGSYCLGLLLVRFGSPQASGLVPSHSALSRPSPSVDVS